MNANMKKKECLMKHCQKEIDASKKDLLEMQEKVKQLFIKQQKNSKYTFQQAMADTKKIVEKYNKKPVMKKMNECIKNKCDIKK
jgi:hypothetical protein